MQIKQAVEQLKALRAYAISKNVRATLSLHREDSHLVRLANSGVSLNTSEALTRVSVTAYADKKTAGVQVMCDLADKETLLEAVDKASEMLQYASPLNYSPTFPVIDESSEDRAGYDEGLAHISNEDILAYINTAAEGLENEDIKLSGNFSVGSTLSINLSTATEHTVVWQATDAQITLVLSSLQDKWEINAEQSAARLSDLDPKAMRKRLSFLRDKYLTCEAQQLPLGPCRVVFGAAATAEYLSLLCYLGVDGGMMKRDNSINLKEDIGKQRLSEKVSLIEDPACLDTFAIPADNHGRRRKKKAWYDKGVFTGFIWTQDAADEHGETATGHDVAHLSYSLLPGDQKVNELEELSALAKEGDLLYVPYLHYTGVVNATEGLITGTSRFGALMFKQDGSIVVPYNVRFTEKLGDLFGEKLRWLSSETTVYNTSSTYDARNPEALAVPKLMCCDDVKVEISNKSY
ncbi:MAG: metallopeptidase TldD-related protein [Bacillota bacterium]|nr:metallopeptidase TldD-related protein [Bacillota bacterium]